MSDLIQKELSYQIVGALYEVCNALGGDYQEKYYQRAIAAVFEKKLISFRREVPINIEVAGVKIGHHFLDFLINETIILEIKKGNQVSMNHIKQVLMYLATTNLQLGILAYIGPSGVKVKD